MRLVALQYWTAYKMEELKDWFAPLLTVGAAIGILWKFGGQIWKGATMVTTWQADMLRYGKQLDDSNKALTKAIEHLEAHDRRLRTIEDKLDIDVG